MRQKLPTVVETDYRVSMTQLPKIDSDFRKKTQIGNLILTLLLTAFLLFSGKSFAQLNESFDGGIPSNWTLFGNGVGTSSWQSTTDGYLGTNGVSINPSADNIGDQNTAKYFLVTPQILVPENGEIHFFTKQGSETDNGTIYEIRLSNAAQPDINGFNILLQTYTESNLNVGSQTEYEERIVELPTSIPTGFPIYIAFVAVNTQNGASATGDEWFVDNVSVMEGCVEVAYDDIIVDNITIEGATVSWSHPTATDFEIQVFPTGGTPAESGIPVTGTTYDLISLDMDTEYDVYIRSLCDNGSFSAWSGPVTFTTLKLGLSCDAPIQIGDILTDGPYILIDNLANYSNPSLTYTTAGSNCISNNGTNYLNGDKIFLTYTASSNALITLTQTTAGYDPSNPIGNCYNNNTAVLIYESCSDVGVSCTAGMATDYNIAQNQIQNFMVEAGQTYIIVVSSDLTPDAGICFQLEIEGSSCAAPSLITYDDLTDTGISFSWNNIGGFADSWDYAIVPTGSGEPTGATATTSTNTGNLVNSGLTAGTTYDIYVRSVCGGSAGDWSNPMTFTMQCATLDTPYFTDFETADSENPELCWTIVDLNNDGKIWEYSYGNPAIRLNNAQTNNNDLIASPKFNLDGATQKRLRFKYNSLNGSSFFSIKMSSTGIGATNFDTVLLAETEIPDSGWDNWIELIVNIPIEVTGEINFAWVIEPNANESATNFGIDDVYIEDKPACPDPLSPMVDEVGTTTATLSWTLGDSESQWQIAIQDEGAGIPTVDGVLVDNNPYTATDLLSSHRYEYYVRAYCNDVEQSQWVGPVTFITDCTTFESPFIESFNDSDSDTKKFCWTFIDANEDGTTWTMLENEPQLQGNNSWFNPTTSFDDYLVTPGINVNGVKQLKFDYRAQFSFFTGPPRFGIEVLMSTTDTNPSSFSVISPLQIFTNSEYLEKTIYFEGNGIVYIAFRVSPEFDIAGGMSILNIDNVRIDDAPPCPIPSAITIAAITEETAEISWLSGYQETNWNIAVQPAGTGLPPANSQASTENIYSASNLLPNTVYEVYVQADCGSETSDWFGPVNFTTLCSAIAAPFVETFNTDSPTEECWRIVNDNDDNETWELNSTTFPYEGDQAAAMFTGSNGQNEDWLISPTITVTENQRLRYYYRVYSSFFTEDLEVLLSTNGIAIDQFTTVLYDSDDDPILINNEEYKEKIINLPPGITGDINIAFHVPYFESFESYRGQILVIDNVHIEDIPECPQPSNITLTNITDTTVDVSWDSNGSETAWEISVQPHGTAAPVGDTDPSYLYNATTNPFTVTDLTASLKYDIYVRAVCDGVEGTWAGPTELLTKCSFENLCQYTIVLISGNPWGVGGGINVIQNGLISQVLEFPTGAWDEEVEPAEYPVFLCTGVEFSLFWDSIGTAPDQYPDAQVLVLDSEGNEVFASPLGIGTPRTTLYTGISICEEVTCPQPTDLTASATTTLSWTAGGTELQWEVAIQTISNGTLPQSGTIVNTNSYQPTTSDFNYSHATYEYFVRAICGTDDKSYWSGPYAFVRNDDTTTALELPVNAGENCLEAITNVSFTNSSVSTESMNYENNNQGDVWFEFTATSPIHMIEVNGFTGNYYIEAGGEPYPNIVMTLYKSLSDGTLDEITCSNNNVIVANYLSNLDIGENYKVRLTCNSPVISKRLFQVCLTTPPDLCAVNVVNYDFERPVLNTPSGITSIMTPNVVPGWRQNMETDFGNSIFIWEALNGPGFTPYSGGQCAQLICDDESFYEEDALIKRGLYQDFDSSETTLYDYSFAQQARGDGNTLQLFAGPPEGPYTLVTENVGAVGVWNLHQGTYAVPAGQTVTRFVFRSKNYAIGNLLDAANFIANNSIISEPYTLDCTENVANVAANGVGIWISSDNNPGTVTFGDANSSTTTISDFVQPGVYTFIWKTRYCENTIEITYNGITELPTVNSPIEYCINTTAQPLTATATGDYTLLWYTQASGGTGSTSAPTPSTTSVGATSYYVANADANGCEGPRVEIVVNVNASITPVATFNYGTESFCLLTADSVAPNLSAGFTVGGVFSSETVTVNATTGVIDISSAAAGTNSITYTVAADNNTCTEAGTYTTTIEVIQITTPVTDFVYIDNTYCLDSGNVLPELATGFTTGGVFSAETGLSINPSTGEINISSSSIGDYTVTYEIIEDISTCTEGSISTYDLSILGEIEVVINGECDESNFVLTALPVNNSFNPNEVTYTWTNSNGTVVGNDSEIFDVTQYADQNQNLTVPIQFNVTIDYGGCSTTASYTVERLACRDIPKGISPGNDGKNDTLDLAGYGVEEINIFNRYGTEVYTFKGTYTNQWYGQSKKGEDLPDGTYFYHINKRDGSEVTGWIYINREK